MAEMTYWNGYIEDFKTGSEKASNGAAPNKQVFAGKKPPKLRRHGDRTAGNQSGPSLVFKSHSTLASKSENSWHAINTQESYKAPVVSSGPIHSNHSRGQNEQQSTAKHTGREHNKQQSKMHSSKSKQTTGEHNDKSVTSKEKITRQNSTVSSSNASFVKSEGSFSRTKFTHEVSFTKSKTSLGSISTPRKEKSFQKTHPGMPEKSKSTLKGEGSFSKASKVKNEGSFSRSKPQSEDSFSKTSMKTEGSFTKSKVKSEDSFSKKPGQKKEGSFSKSKQKPERMKTETSFISTKNGDDLERRLYRTDSKISLSSRGKLKSQDSFSKPTSSKENGKSLDILTKTLSRENTREQLRNRVQGSEQAVAAENARIQAFRNQLMKSIYTNRQNQLMKIAHM